jgi:hypothetical protein
MPFSPSHRWLAFRHPAFAVDRLTADWDHWQVFRGAQQHAVNGAGTRPTNLPAFHSASFRPVLLWPMFLVLTVMAANFAESWR